MDMISLNFSNIQTKFPRFQQNNTVQTAPKGLKCDVFEKNKAKNISFCGASDIRALFYGKLKDAYWEMDKINKLLTDEAANLPMIKDLSAKEIEVYLKLQEEYSKLYKEAPISLVDAVIFYQLNPNEIEKYLSAKKMFPSLTPMELMLCARFELSKKQIENYLSNIKGVEFNCVVNGENISHVLPVDEALFLASYSFKQADIIKFIKAKLQEKEVLSGIRANKSHKVQPDIQKIVEKISLENYRDEIKKEESIRRQQAILNPKMIKGYPKKDILLMLDSGMTSEDIAIKIGCSHAHLERVLSYWGFENKMQDAMDSYLHSRDYKEKLAVQARQIVEKMLSEGKSKIEISQKLGIPYGTVEKHSTICAVVKYDEYGRVISTENFPDDTRIVLIKKFSKETDKEVDEVISAAESKVKSRPKLVSSSSGRINREVESIELYRNLDVIKTGSTFSMFELFSSLRRQENDVAISVENLIQPDNLGLYPAGFVEFNNGILRYTDGNQSFGVDIQKMYKNNELILLINDLNNPDNRYVAIGGAIAPMKTHEFDLTTKLGKQKAKQLAQSLKSHCRDNNSFELKALVLAVQNFVVNLTNQNGSCIISQGLEEDILGEKIESFNGAVLETDELADKYKDLFTSLNAKGKLTFENILKIMPKDANIEIHPYSNDNILYSVCCTWRDKDGKNWELRVHSTDVNYSNLDSKWVLRCGYYDGDNPNYYSLANNDFNGAYFGDDSHIPVESPIEQDCLLNNIHFQNIVSQISVNGTNTMKANEILRECKIRLASDEIPEERLVKEALLNPVLYVKYKDFVDKLRASQGYLML